METGLPFNLSFLLVKCLCNFPSHFFSVIKLASGIYAKQLWGSQLFAKTLLKRKYKLEHFLSGLGPFRNVFPVNRKKVKIKRMRFGKHVHLKMINLITEARNYKKSGQTGEIETLVLRIGQRFALNPNHLLIIHQILNEALMGFVHYEGPLKNQFKTINFKKIKHSHSLTRVIKLSCPWGLLHGDGFLHKPPSINVPKEPSEKKQIKRNLRLSYDSQDEESSVEV